MRRSFISGVLPFLLGTAALCQGQVISTLAGTGSATFSGDNGPANKAAVNSPFGVAVDNNGTVFIADFANNRIRKIDGTGVISTVAGCGELTTACILVGIGDGGPATAPLFLDPWDIVVDNAGSFYFTDSGNGRIRKVDANGIITTVAGGGAKDLGENVAATSTKLGNPVGLAIDRSGNLYVAEVDNNRVRKVSTSGNIVTIAGTGKEGYSGDGGVATSAMLDNPHGVGVDAAGNVYVVDTLNYRIRKVDTSGVITTVAGNGQILSTKDGVAATSTTLTTPWDVKLDAAGNLFISEWLGYRIRKVDTHGIITTVAGTGNPGYSGDGGAATSANLQGPTGIALDPAGAIYFADSTGNRIRKVSAAPPPPPSITANGVVNGASFQPGLVAGAWATVQGSNLAAVVDNWNNFIVGGKLPTTFDGVGVTIGGRPAYLNYISPAQINMLLPPDAATGPNQLIVTTSSGASSAYGVTVNAYGPAFFTWPSGQAVATRQDFTFAVKNGTFSGVTTVAAKPGDVLILWGTGFGPTIPAVPPGIQVPATVTYSTSTPPAVTINGIAATVYGAALAPGYAGLYQVAIQVPPALADGDWPVKATIGGVQSPTGVVLSVQH